MTETAKRADVIFPAASAYEKDGTVTNVTGEVQQLKRASKTMGAKPDLEIFGLIAREMGIRDFLPAKPDAVLEQIRKTVRGYNVPLACTDDRRSGADDAREWARTRCIEAGVDPICPRHAVYVRFVWAAIRISLIPLWSATVFVSTIPA